MSDAMDTFFNDETVAESEEVITEEMTADSDNAFDIMDAAFDAEAKVEAKSDEKEDKVEVKADTEEEKEDEAEEVVEKEDEKEDEKEEVVENAPETKKLTAKVGEEDVEIASNATFKHKVDGEEVDVNLQDLLNNYSGKVSYDKKFQELSTEKNEFVTERKQVEDYIDKFAEKVHSKDVLGAMEYFASFAGIDGLNFRNQLREEMAPFFKGQADLTEDQVKLQRLEEENNYYKQQQESESAQLVNQQSQEALNNEINQIQETHNLDDNALLSIYDELKATEKGEITPQMIGEHAVKVQSLSKSEALLSQSGVELEDNNLAIENLANLMVENKDFSDDDWNDVIKQAYGEAPKKVSKSKVVSDKIKKTQKQENETETINNKIGINSDVMFDFDDLD